MEEPPSKIPDPLVDAMLEQGLLKAPTEQINLQNTITADPPSSTSTNLVETLTTTTTTSQTHVPIDKGENII